MKTFTKLGKKRLTGNAEIKYESGFVRTDKFSTTEGDFKWLNDNMPIANDMKLIRLMAHEILDRWENSLDFLFILRNGNFFFVDDYDLFFKDEESESEELENSLYVFYEIAEQCCKLVFGETDILEYNQYFNIIAPIESNLHR